VILTRSKSKPSSLYRCFLPDTIPLIVFNMIGSEEGVSSKWEREQKYTGITKL